nr:formate/nitrite transporter family protein [Actinomycetota bacterium]
MPLTIPEAATAQGQAAVAKAAQVKRLPLYLALSVAAGAFVGVAVVLLVSVSGPLVAAGSPWAKLVQGVVFGVALTLIVFAGAELFTGNAMVMLQGLLARTVTAKDLAAVWVASLVGNLIGSIGFAAVVHGGGTLGVAPPGKPAPGAGLIDAIVAGKHAATGPQLFWRSVLCNMLVCLALWMAARASGDGAKLAVVWWGLLAFIGSGFEHSIANMTVFALGVFQGAADWGMLARNLAWTVPGNVVGGGILVGLLYGWAARPVVVPLAAVPAVPLADPL